MHSQLQQKEFASKYQVWSQRQIEALAMADEV
jgi:hypothetical protein